MKDILASPSQSDSLKFWQNVMADFCSDDLQCGKNVRKVGKTFLELGNFVFHFLGASNNNMGQE